MNKLLGKCYDHTGKFLATMDNNSEEYILENFKQMFLNKLIQVKVIPNSLEMKRLEAVTKLTIIENEIDSIELIQIS